MSAIQEIIKEIKNLKPIPRIANQILSTVENPNASPEDVAEIIVYDPITTANILRTCNSSYYGLARKVDSVREAVTLIGMDAIVDIVLLKSGAENLNREQPGYGLDEGDLWRNSVASALIARSLCERRGLANTHMLFTAALLKDIGKVILNRFVAEALPGIQDLVQNQGTCFREAEKRVIGVDHAELGGLVTSNWKFSPKMVYIIQNHHLSDLQAREDIETCIVYLSDIICMMMGIGGGADGLNYRFHGEVAAKLGFTERELQETIACFGEKMATVDDLIASI